MFTHSFHPTYHTRLNAMAYLENLRSARRGQSLKSIIMLNATLSKQHPHAKKSQPPNIRYFWQSIMGTPTLYLANQSLYTSDVAMIKPLQCARVQTLLCRFLIYLAWLLFTVVFYGVLPLVSTTPTNRTTPSPRCHGRARIQLTQAISASINFQAASPTHWFRPMPG